MTVQSKPIPALYIVYILRSTTRHASLYIGSTPNPPRRLKQHNGESKGGATRTARKSLQPWEMVGVVSGFPSMVAALKFEWALTNPHLSLHIAPEDRITVSSQVKRNGRPKRPPHNIIAILSNLHLLLRVPSFARWPLRLHFFDREVYSKWNSHCAKPGLEPLDTTLEVVTDFEPLSLPAASATSGSRQGARGTNSALADSSSEDDQEESEDDEMEKDLAVSGPKWGVHALPLDHSPIGQYLEKGHEMMAFERQGNCVVCRQDLETNKGLYAICTSSDCEGAGHLDCWSRHFLQQSGGEENAAILPMEGKCPTCKATVKWGDMMRELTLRMRGQKEVDKILKKRRKAAGVTKTKTKAKTNAKVKVKAKAADKASPTSKKQDKAKPDAKETTKGKRKTKSKAKASVAASDGES